MQERGDAPRVGLRSGFGGFGNRQCAEDRADSGEERRGVKRHGSKRHGVPSLCIDYAGGSIWSYSRLKSGIHDWIGVKNPG
jgi:hypothetical protein